MKTVFYALFALAVMGLGFWAYQQDYATREVLRETDAERREIARLRERLTVLRAEWAYLNRPDRLRDLANLNFDRLELFPLAPEQFGHVEQIAYPATAAELISEVIEVRGTLSEARP